MILGHVVNTEFHDGTATIYLRRIQVCCPFCESPRLGPSERSIDQGDNSRRQWRTCPDCRMPYFTVIENDDHDFPTVGNSA